MTDQLSPILLFNSMLLALYLFLYLTTAIDFLSDEERKRRRRFLGKVFLLLLGMALSVFVRFDPNSPAPLQWYMIYPYAVVLGAVLAQRVWVTQHISARYRARVVRRAAAAQQRQRDKDQRTAAAAQRARLETQQQARAVADRAQRVVTNRSKAVAILDDLSICAAELDNTPDDKAVLAQMLRSSSTLVEESELSREIEANKVLRAEIERLAHRLKSLGYASSPVYGRITTLFKIR